MRRLTEDEIIDFMVGLGGVAVQVASEGDGSPEAAWGDTFFFYDPDDDPRARRLPFVTIVASDYPGFDTASELDRPGVYRLNVSLSRGRLGELLGDLHEGDEGAHDYAALDRLLPHPIYAKQGWVSILNPSEASRDQVESLLIEAHSRATDSHRHGDD